MKLCYAFLLTSALYTGGCASKAPRSAAHSPWEGKELAADIMIDGPEEDQQAVRSFIYYLTEYVGEGRLDPFGGTNPTYSGHVFWDADVWVFPALALIDPQRAKAIPDFRLSTAAMAMSETDATYLTHAQSFASSSPIQFPWESDALGHDVTQGPTKKEIHVSGDVVWGLDLAAKLGLADPKLVNEIGRGVASFYLARSHIQGGSQLRELRNVTGVDEWFEGDNCLYTNAIAEWTVQKYLDGGAEFYLPRNAARELIAYDGDPERAYQQSAAPLLLWPLERADLVGDPIKFLERFEGKESPNGPAMSKSVYALIHARYGDPDKALEVWRRSWQDCTKGNADLRFSERPGRRDLTYFVTGAAGCLNAVVYGFLGARIVSEEPADEAKIQLEDGTWLVFRPNLPKDWKSVTFKGLAVRGREYILECKGTTATLRVQKE